MATSYGLAYVFEDKTGALAGSDFVEIYDRMRLTLRCTARDSMHTAYMIYNTSNSCYSSAYKPLAALDFGPNNTLGTVAFNSGGHMPMGQYLVKLSTLGKRDSKLRKFVASDGQEYRWSWSIKRDQEWTCTNTRGGFVASYCPMPDNSDRVSTGSMFTVEETHQHIIVDILASLMIMRHIVAYNL